MYGQKLTPSSCTELHDEVVSYMGTDASFQRFIHDDSVCGQVVCSSGHPESLCEHVATDIMKYASVFVKYAKNCMSISVRTCYCVNHAWCARHFGCVVLPQKPLGGTWHILEGRFCFAFQYHIASTMLFLAVLN